MKFNPTEAEESLYKDCLFWSGATTTTFPVDPDFTRSANFALDICNAIILRSNDKSQYDDRDNTGELIATINLTSGTQAYSIQASWLKIARVRVKDSNGNWQTLRKVDRSQIGDSALASSGTPYAYDILGNYIYLVATPNYSSTNGIEIQFQRGSDHFVVGDTDKEPGFAPQFHRLVSMMPSLDFTESNKQKDKAAVLRNRIGEAPDLKNGKAGFGLLKELSDFYSDRDRDGAPSMSLRRDDYGQSAMGNYGSHNDPNPRGFNY